MTRLPLSTLTSTVPQTLAPESHVFYVNTWMWPRWREIEQPCRPNRDLTPTLNLDEVLRYLTEAPFEPLRLLSTSETLFLIALATALYW